MLSPSEVLLIAKKDPFDETHMLEPHCPLRRRPQTTDRHKLVSAENTDVNYSGFKTPSFDRRISWPERETTNPVSAALSGL
jgi:hypothetical protein